MSKTKQPISEAQDYLTVVLGMDTKRKLRLAAAMKETTMSRLARDLITAGLDQMTAGLPSHD